MLLTGKFQRRYLPMGLCDGGAEGIDLLNEESISGARSGRASERESKLFCGRISIKAPITHPARACACGVIKRIVRKFSNYCFISSEKMIMELLIIEWYTLDLKEVCHGPLTSMKFVQGLITYTVYYEKDRVTKK